MNSFSAINLRFVINFFITTAESFYKADDNDLPLYAVVAHIRLGEAIRVHKVYIIPSNNYQIYHIYITLN